MVTQRVPCSGEPSQPPAATALPEGEPRGGSGRQLRTSSVTAFRRATFPIGEGSVALRGGDLIHIALLGTFPKGEDSLVRNPNAFPYGEGGSP